jgi:acylphosphatase
MTGPGRGGRSGGAGGDDRGGVGRGGEGRPGRGRGGEDRSGGGHAGREASGARREGDAGATRARARVRVTGLVQGVWYRQSAADEANRLGLAGRVRNRADGSVEAEVEGSREAIEALLRWCRRGPPAARVEAVEVEWEAPRGEPGPFRVER